MTYLCDTLSSSGQSDNGSFSISQTAARFWGVPGVSTSVALDIDFINIDKDAALSVSVELHLMVGAIDGLALGC